MASVVVAIGKPARLNGRIAVEGKRGNPLGQRSRTPRVGLAGHGILVRLCS